MQKKIFKLYTGEILLYEMQKFLSKELKDVK